MARPVDTPELARKREREAQMVSQMIALWCRGHHGGGHVVEQAGDDESVRVKLGLRTITLCPECAELQKYAIARIEHCPHMGTKTFCSACPSHCYRPAMREKIREVMRWSGPRMIRYRPITAVRHAMVTVQAKRAAARSKWSPAPARAAPPFHSISAPGVRGVLRAAPLQWSGFTKCKGVTMPACPLVDCHTHTSFSDGHASFEDNVRAAAAAGCRVMVSTDHLTLPASMDANCEVQVVEGDLPAHRLAFEDARKLAAQIAPELTFIYGFECDWYEGCEPLVEHWSQGAVVRLGSVHWIGNPGDIAAGAAGTAGTEDVARPDTPDSLCGWIDDDTNLHVWENLGVRGVWECYVDDWCRACESSLNFDAMAHPDLVMRFSKDGFAPDFDPAPFWEQMAECAHDTGRRVEVSTAAPRKGLDDYYPATGLLRRFAHAEVPITFGSDAHRACDICWNIREAQAHAYDCGYRAFDIPHPTGEWESTPLA